MTKPVDFCIHDITGYAHEMFVDGSQIAMITSGQYADCCIWRIIRTSPDDILKILKNLKKAGDF